MVIDIRKVKTYYINLKKDINKKKNIEKVLTKNNFEKYQRIEGVLSKISSLGAAYSHIKTVEIAIQNDEYPYLILEDDVDVFNKDFLIEIPDDADAMYLGLSRFGLDLSQSPKTQDQVIIKDFNEKNHRVINMLAIHAVLHLNKKYDLDLIEYYKMFVDDPIKFVAVDIPIIELNKKENVYALNNPIFYQNDWKNKEFTNKSIYDINYKIIK